MANRGYPNPEGRFDMGDGKGDTGRMVADQSTVPDLCCPTSVGEQIARGGWTRSDTPLSEDGSLPPDHKYQGGTANGSDRAAYPGTPNPTPGQTY